MDPRKATLEQLLQTLIDEEHVLAELVSLATDEQNALVLADHAAIQAVSAVLQTVAAGLEGLEKQRESLLSSIDGGCSTLSDLLPLARTLGVTGFAEAQTRLRARATELRQAQERNARLILGALRLRERWFNLLGGVGRASTYGAAGRQDAGLRRGFVSRSA